MEKTKKNNKGFSLVELIVVVLIMAIIAVAMAPQVMKWVNNSRVATDVSNYDSLVANCQLALTDATTYDALKTKTVILEMSSAGVKNATTGSDATAYGALDTQLKKIIDAKYADTCKAKVTSETYKITITNGVVTRTAAPSSTME